MTDFPIHRILFLFGIAILPSCANQNLVTVKRIEFPEVNSRSQDHSLSKNDQTEHAELFAGKRLLRGFSKPDSYSQDGFEEILPVSSEVVIQSPLKKSVEPTKLKNDPLGEFPIPNSSDEPLTLSQLEQMALETNPTLEQAAAAVEKANGIYHQVGLYPNPTIGYQAAEIGNEGAAGQQGGFLSQNIITGDKLRLNRDVMAWELEVLGSGYDTQKFRVVNDVRFHFYAVLGEQRRVGISRDLVRVAEEGARVAEELFKAKQGARADILQAKVELNEVRIILQNALLRREAAWREMANVIGRPDLPQSQLKGDLKDEIPKREWENDYQSILDQSPELQVAHAQVSKSLAELDRQEVQMVPNYQTQLGVARDTSTGDTIANIQIGFTLPYFNRNEGNIAAAQAEYTRAVRNVERLKLSLKSRLAVTFRDFQMARQQAVRYHKDILPTAKENLDLTEEGYKQGEFNFLRVLTARRTYFETNLRYVSSLISLQQSDVILSGFLLTGGLNEPANTGGSPTGLGQRGFTFGQQ